MAPILCRKSYQDEGAPGLAFETRENTNLDDLSRIPSRKGGNESRQRCTLSRAKGKPLVPGAQRKNRPAGTEYTVRPVEDLFRTTPSPACARKNAKAPGYQSGAFANWVSMGMDAA